MNTTQKIKNSLLVNGYKIVFCIFLALSAPVSFADTSGGSGGNSVTTVSPINLPSTGDTGIATTPGTPGVPNGTPIPGRYSNSNGFSLVRCDGVVTAGEGNEVQCNFNLLMTTVNYVIQWLFYFSIPITVALFTYAGVQYMSGEPKKIATAKNVFNNVAKGFAIMITAYLIVTTLVGWLVNPDQGFGTFLGG